MLLKLFSHSLRNLQRQKSYVLINLLGLATGIASSLIIALYVIHELNYDNFHEKKDQIYRVILNGKLGEQEVNVSYSASPLGPAMRDEFPEVADFMRMNTWGPTIISYNHESWSEENFIEADSSFFNLFSFPLLSGNARDVLNEPNVMVLSRSVAEKIFGKEDPIGKSIKVANIETPYRVTGVMEDLPGNTHLQANIITSFMTNDRANDNQWLSNSFETYVVLKEGADPARVDQRFPALISKNIGPEIDRYFGISLEEFLSGGNKYNMRLQKLRDIHLDPTIAHSLKPAADPKYLYIFSVISLLIIIIAAINFMNLSTAQASKRSREVGMKKVSGSTRTGLILQFLFESVILTLIALVLALVVIRLSLPYFNQLLNVSLELDIFSQWYNLPVLILFTLVVGLFAGSYPSFYLSSFQPVHVLKSSEGGGKGNRKLRSGLVVLQFSISIILIIGSAIMFRQISFMLNKDLGFNRENLLVISSAQTIGDKVYSFKEELRKIPGIVQVSSSTAVPGHNNNTNGYGLEGRSNESFLLETNWVDYDYLETFGFGLIEGRFFSRDFPTDKESCLINQSAIDHFGLDKAIGTRFMNADDGGQLKPMHVIGVVRNFHFRSLADEIQPYVLRFKSENVNWGYITIRLAGNTNHELIDKIEENWKLFAPDQPMQYFFLDESFNQMYNDVRKNASLAVIFSILAILIAALGLYGLTSYTVEQRTREIGIRKALGASVGKIFVLIAREIIILICVSAVIGTPVIYYLSRGWLQNYYYRIDAGIWDFLPGLAIALLIALLTISYKTITTARLNPANSLRYE